MNSFHIDGNIIIFKDVKYTIDDFFTKHFLKKSDIYSKDYNFDSLYVNELFLSTFQPYLALKEFVQSNNISKVTLRKPNTLLHAITLDLEKNGYISLEGSNGLWLILKSKLRINLYFLATAFYLLYTMVRIPYRRLKTHHPNGKFIITRSNSAEKKFINFKFPKHQEDFKNRKSMYSYFSVYRRLYWVFKSLFYSYEQIRNIKNNVERLVGVYCVAVPYSFYASRMVHTLLYKYLLDAFFRQHLNETLYTGNNLDRFSVIEETLAKKYGIKTICIPHGLEYGFRFPKGFSCDIFYATTQNAASHLNNLYKTNKFIFDQSIAELMFKVSGDKKINEKRVVFFTEPREVEVNVSIINNLVLLLKKDGIALYLKLHPKDNLENYISCDISIIESLEEALIGNICIARKSTTLLECIYNDSKASAIIINPKDESLFYTFPSLQSESIHVSKNIDSLANWINLNLKQNS